MRRVQMEDWLEDLAEFGPDIVSEATGRWRRTESRRPTPADIRRFAIEARNERPASEELAALPAREEKAARAERNRARDIEMQRGGRAIVNEWAQQRGHADFDAYAAAKGIHWSTAYREVIASILAGAPAVKGFASPAAALGVKAREFTAEEMAAGRRELGLGEFGLSEMVE